MVVQSIVVWFNTVVLSEAYLIIWIDVVGSAASAVFGGNAAAAVSIRARQNIRPSNLFIMSVFYRAYLSI